MKRIVVLAIVATMAAITSPIGALAQSAKDFVGTWTFVSAITERDGQKLDTFGPNAQGLLMFDAKGRYTITFIGATLPKFASNNRAAGTADENKAVIAGSLAHFGAYSVDEAGKSFTFRIEKATYPNWDGTEQKRAFVMTGDELKYTTPPGAGSAGGTATVTWRRAK
jgi:hypothetical protein